MHFGHAASISPCSSWKSIPSDSTLKYPDLYNGLKCYINLLNEPIDAHPVKNKNNNPPTLPDMTKIIESRAFRAKKSPAIQIKIAAGQYAQATFERYEFHVMYIQLRQNRVLTWIMLEILLKQLPKINTLQ